MKWRRQGGAAVLGLAGPLLVAACSATSAETADGGKLKDASFAEAGPSNSDCAALARCCDEPDFDTAYLADCRGALVAGSESMCYADIVSFVQQGACGAGFNPGPLQIPVFNDAGMLIDAGTLTDVGTVPADATTSQEASPPPGDGGRPKDTGADTTVHDSGHDSGKPPKDAGHDAGMPPKDAGHDAGMPEKDAGHDAGMPPKDAGADT